jgi:hypothetical protein
MTWTVARTNAVLAIVFTLLVLFYFESVRERLLPPMYDEAASFSRVDPQPGWMDTGIVVEAHRPIGIVASGRVSTPRLINGAGSEPNKPYEVGPDGADVEERRILDWRELDAFRAFALVGRVAGGQPFLVGRRATVTMPGRLELKINCPLWDKSILDDPGTVKRRRRSPLTGKELANLHLIRGFFAYRTWDLAMPAPRAPHLPLSAAEIAVKYGAIHDTGR